VVVCKEREREGREWRVLNFEYSLFAVLDAFHFGYIAREDFATPSSSLSLRVCVYLEQS
jgi:hypothetical protein